MSDFDRAGRNGKTAEVNFHGTQGRSRTYPVAKVGDVLGGNLEVTRVPAPDAWGRRVEYRCIGCGKTANTHDYMARRGHTNCVGWAPERKGALWGLERALRWARQEMGDTRPLHVRVLVERKHYVP